MSYLGAKSGSGVYQAIINIMPPHDTYIETHLGSGAIMKLKAPARRTIGLDLNTDVLREARISPDFNLVELYDIDASCFLDSNKNEIKEKTLVYCDPPYMLETRTSNKRYRFEYDNSDHQLLLKTLLSMPDRFSIIISGYRTSMYDEILADWNSLDFQAMTRGGVRTETLWFNFDLGAVHWHKYAGKDFTDRQRIQRKCKRWGDNYRNLPAAERQAIMATLLAVECEL